MVGRIPVMDVTPVLGCDRYPAKATVGEPFPVTAVVFREGHDLLNADVAFTGPDGKPRATVRMHQDPDGVDLWRAEFTPDEVGPWTFAIESWSDPLATWRHNAEIK
ncbi:MAG: maltotransferase domain-containing protein, partial [Nocardioidaceae bacterium]